MVQDCVTVVTDGYPMIALIKQSMETGLQHIREVRRRLLQDTSQKLLLILTNMQGIITEQRRKRRVGTEALPQA